LKRKLLDLMHANRNVDAQDELAAQVRAFGELGLDYHAALDALNSVLGEIGLGSYDERDGMASQHWLLFSGIGLKCDIKTIL
jgi:Tat protein secretion system quality control protein TatD with DNase activity